eukprot:3132058-Rhodomonas_salina.4
MGLRVFACRSSSTDVSVRRYQVQQGRILLRLPNDHSRGHSDSIEGVAICKLIPGTGLRARYVVSGTDVAVWSYAIPGTVVA